MRLLNVLWIFIAVTVAVLTVIWFYPADDDFDVGNSAWNGLSVLSERLEATTIDSFSSLPSREGGTALILVPYTAFTNTELDQLKTYVLEGGILVLMDDYGYGNEVLAALNVDYRFSKTLLLDPLLNFKNERFPKVTDFEDKPLVSDVEAIICDYSSSLIDVPVNQVVARSSSFSFLDEDGDRVYADGVDSKGPFPVIAYTPLEKGGLVAISDPSLFINNMIDMENNYNLISNAIRLRTQNPTVYLDQSHLIDSAFSKTKAALAKVRNVVAYPEVLFGMVGAVLMLAFGPLWNKRR